MAPGLAELKSSRRLSSACRRPRGLWCAAQGTEGSPGAQERACVLALRSVTCPPQGESGSFELGVLNASFSARTSSGTDPQPENNKNSE